MQIIKIIYKTIFLFLFFLSTYGFSEIVSKIKISGNDRISDETIKLFIKTKINDEIDDIQVNNILKDLYETNFFKDISINFKDQILYIKVQENPIIENISYNGIKSSRIIEIIKDKTLIK